MNPYLDILATAAGSIALAAFFLWLLISAVGQERDGIADRRPSGSQSRPTRMKPAKPAGKGGFVHG